MGPIEELYGQLALEEPDARRHVRLHGRQRLRRLGHAAETGRGGEYVEVVEIHVITFSDGIVQNKSLLMIISAVYIVIA